MDLNTVDDDVAALRAATPEGRGADAAVDAAGQPSAWENCIGIIRKGGLVNLFGGCRGGSKITAGTAWMYYDGLTIAGFYHTTPTCVRMAFDMVCPPLAPRPSAISLTWTPGYTAVPQRPWRSCHARKSRPRVRGRLSACRSFPLTKGAGRTALQ